MSTPGRSVMTGRKLQDAAVLPFLLILGVFFESRAYIMTVRCIKHVFGLPYMHEQRIRKTLQWAPCGVNISLVSAQMSARGRQFL